MEDVDFLRNETIEISGEISGVPLREDKFNGTSKNLSDIYQNFKLIVK